MEDVTLHRDKIHVTWDFCMILKPLQRHNVNLSMGPIKNALWPGGSAVQLCHPSLQRRRQSLHLSRATAEESESIIG